MNDPNRKTWATRLRPPSSAAALITCIFISAIGHRGLSVASHAQLVASQKIAQIMSEAPSLKAMAGTLNSPHPHIDLISGLWLRLIPGDHGAALAMLSALALLMCLGALWRIISRHTQGNTLAASMACATFALLPSTAAQLGGPSPTLITCALFLMTWDLCTRAHQRWWQAILSWVTGGLLLGSWSPMLLWACVLLIAHLTQRAQSEESKTGMIPGSSIPAGILLCVPMVPLVATLLHPGFWPDLKQGWLMTLEAGWITNSPKGLSYGGHWYGQGKLSWVATCAQLIGQIPLVTMLMSMPGVLWLLRTKRSVHHRLLLISLPIMTLIVWATPGHDYGHVAQHTLWVSMVAMLVGHGVAWCMNQAATTQWHRAIMPALCISVVLAAIVPTFSFWSTPAMWQSSITGGAVSAQRQGDSHSRHIALPIADLKRQVREHDIRTLHAGALNPILRSYNLSEVHVSETLGAQGALLDFTPRFSPDTPVRPSLFTQERPLVFLGKPAAPAFFITLSK